MVRQYVKIGAAALALAGATALATTQASAAGTHHHHRHHAHAGDHRLVSDGPGTPFGFHRDPAPFRMGYWRHRYRQANATHQAAMDDALTSGGYWGFPGDSVYGAGNYGSYGVFDGADGYGSPFFAGFYGPGDGTDYGPFGQGYDD